MAKKKAALVKGILEKMDLEFSTKISETRARAKLERAIEKDGLPEDIELDDDEIKYLESLGYELDEDDEGPDMSTEEKDVPEADEDDFDDDDDEDEDDDFDDDFDDDEEEKPKHHKRKNIKSAPAKEDKEKHADKKIKKMSKFTAIIQILKKKKNHTMDEIAKKADELYVQNGGKSNVNGTMKFVVTIIRVLEEYGILAKKEDKVKIL